MLISLAAIDYKEVSWDILDQFVGRLLLTDCVAHNVNAFWLPISDMWVICLKSVSQYSDIYHNIANVYNYI